ncbi:urease subunit beta [Echinicola strongylocentroti]|uniref:Urease subunit beta n=1 Tax=Echinicola strongylocentroti TaxID=1795355 RepID=A0A2Z4IDT7_9BACT|nr:urease subunit beta [Echinicola strongylocentroti]AWW28658.1 urease subunit beta [Echinicola strongylocentroti]
MIPGEYVLKDEPIKCNAKHESITLMVTNTGDRPIQVGSHFHFFEVNKSLSFDREKAFGKRMDILAGMAKRFEPGESMEVQLIDLSGDRKAYGASNLTQGDTTSESNRKSAIEKLHSQNFKTS